MRRSGSVTCVDMVSRVVTPRATLAGTDLLSSQKETWGGWVIELSLPTRSDYMLGKLLQKKCCLVRGGC